VVSGLDEWTPEPLFASQPVTGVRRRRATLPTSEEVAPVVVAYLRQVGGDTLPPRELEALLPPSQAPVRSRETVMLIALAVLLFAAAFAVAFALLPIALS
jgi:hypothetical protein